MKKIKIKQRLENAAAAFFADENLSENNLESFRNEANLWQEKESSSFLHKSNTLETILKQVFLFFPGTFVLYMMSLVFTVMLISFFVRPSGDLKRFEFGGILVVFLASTFMTWLGLGDVRKPKHLVIPASIITVGVTFGAIAGVLAAISNEFGKVIFNNSYPLYILPLALTVPFLAKGWVDRKVEN